MATTAFTAFLPEVLPHVAGCADVIATNAVRNACIEFCAESFIWNEVQDAERVTDADFPYTVTAPSGARVAGVLDVMVNGQRVSPSYLDALGFVPNWQDVTAEQPSVYVQADPETLVFYPRLSVPANLVVRAAYAPTRAATGIVSFVYQEYLEEIAAGALAKLMLVPGQPFTNPDLSAFYNDRFEKATTLAAVRANKSFTRTGVSIAMRPFA
jgi:hypothetical protein